MSTYKTFRIFDTYFAAKIIEHNVEQWTIKCQFISGEKPDQQISLNDVAEIYNVIKR